jgi:hypothetical protein
MQSRCVVCNKKLGLIPFKCKCEEIFCSTHRAPEDHKCTYDFKTEGKAWLEKNNKVCITQKLDNKI